MECGASLGSRCSQCGAPLRTEARFCQKCGHQLVPWIRITRCSTSLRSMKTSRCRCPHSTSWDSSPATTMGAINWAEIGFCALAAGDVERASELFHKGLTISTAMKYLARPQLLGGSAFVELVKGRSDEAAKLVHEARQFVEERAMQHLYAFVAFAGAQVSAAQGRGDQALDNFTQAEEQALRMQMRPLVWQARSGAAQVLFGAGRTSKAEAKRAEATDMVDEIAGLFKDEKLRGMFLESATSKLA